MQQKLLLLGAGELGLMLTRSAKKHGLHVVAVDHYENAPAMHEAHNWHLADLRNNNRLLEIINREKPNYIIPEIETVSSEFLVELEKSGRMIYPNANAIKLAFNKRKTLSLARKLKLNTPDFIAVSTLDELILATKSLGLPCVVKPAISFSGLGQSIIKYETEIEGAWNKAKKARADHKKILVEEFIPIEQEITLLLVRQEDGNILICPPIGHTTKRGAFSNSWQPALVESSLLKEAESMALTILESVKGLGVWSVEFFISKGKVYFNEICPRPHSSGLVTLAGSQSLNQFDLHIKAMLGSKIDKVDLVRAAASQAILTESFGNKPQISGLESIEDIPNTTVELFNKPITKPYRRMGIALSFSENTTEIEAVKASAKMAADQVKIK